MNPETENLDALVAGVKSCLADLLDSQRCPSAAELVEEVQRAFSLKAMLVLRHVLLESERDSALPAYFRQYLRSLVREGPEGERSELDEALVGGAPRRQEAQTGIDQLIHRSRAYRGSDAFQDMISFMARFREYAPYNNMLVRLQNSSCSFYATEADWLARFGRTLKEDARPMLILAPMHPVMLVYELDQTEGPELPDEVKAFGQFSGEWDPSLLERITENAARRDRIRIAFKRLSSTNAGFATMSPGDGEHKMRIAIHEELDPPSRFGVICHELAHIYLGHLGSDRDRWWPCRINLDRHSIEIEAEAVAYLVTSRLGLQGASHSYVSRHFVGGEIPASVSIDFIAKVASRIEDMARHRLEPRRERSRRGRTA